jgi:hypothetical protein
LRKSEGVLRPKTLRTATVAGYLPISTEIRVQAELENYGAATHLEAEETVTMKRQYLSIYLLLSHYLHVLVSNVSNGV